MIRSGQPTRLYRIICLKRSEFVDMARFQYHSDWFRNCDVVYWMPNAQGYTRNRQEAGLYTGLDLENIYGKHLDFFIDPVGDDE